MKKGYTFWFFIGSLFAGQLLLTGMKYPVSIYSPGDLAAAHSKLRCKDCHAPFKNIASESCSVAKCHPDGRIGKKPAIIDLHDKMKGKDCLICHTDHLGPNGKITKAINHDAFLKISKCIDCHKMPTDELHRGISESCGDCHVTKAWKPSTYNHEKYFFLDKDHKVSCSKCHDTGSYKKYTCLNCHEHSGPRVDRKHRKEGISNYSDCLRCHKVRMNGRSYGTARTHEGMGGEDDEHEDEGGERRYRGHHDDDDD